VPTFPSHPISDRDDPVAISAVAGISQRPPARSEDNEAFYVRLDEECVRAWLDANGIVYTPPSPNSRLGASIIDVYDTINPEGHGFSSWLDEYRGNATADSRNLCSYVYTLLHTRRTR
jgi:hypothetical protein